MMGAATAESERLLSEATAEIQGDPGRCAPGGHHHPDRRQERIDRHLDGRPARRPSTP